MYDVTFKGTIAAFVVSDDVFRLRFSLVMQPSGRVLVEVRGIVLDSRLPIFLSSYEGRILANGYVDNTMYAGNTRLWVSDKTAGTIQYASNVLREMNDHEPALGPDRSFALKEYFHG
jgi:hypothetical protein